MYVQPRYCSEWPPIWLNPAPLPGFQGSVAWYPPPSSPRDVPSSLDLLGLCLCSWLFSVWHYLQPPPPLTALQDTQGSAPLGSLSRTPTPTPIVGSRPLQDPLVPAHTPPYLHSPLHVHLTVWLFSLSCWRENFKSLLLKIHSFSSEIGFLKDVQKHRKRSMNKQGWTWEEI